MTIALIAARLAGVCLVLWWAYAVRQVRKRQAQRDELRFLLSPVIEHSTADRILSGGRPQ